MKKRDFDLRFSDKAGGKAGRGCNKTATIQLIEWFNSDSYLLLRQFRYSTRDPVSLANAVKMAECALREAKEHPEIYPAIRL